ncbi:MAG: HEPN domain-containing protein [Crocinitomicaceae bacterium]
MNINKTNKGFFWIPSEPNNQKNGSLNFLDETAYVNIFDSFDIDPSNIKTKNRTEFCSIYGILDNGRCCVLHKCQLSLAGILGGVISTNIKFEYIIYSSNRDLINKKKEFSKIEFKLSNLFHWSGKNSIKSFNNEDNTRGLVCGSTYNEDVIFSNDSFELKLNHAPPALPLNTNKKNILIEQDTSLILTLKLDEEIFKSFEFIEKIQDLFILFHADKIDINNTYKLTSVDNEEYFFCYSNRIRFRGANGCPSYEYSNLFTLIELKEFVDINVLFSSWFKMYETLNYPIDLISKCLSDINMNKQHKFMNLMYGLEYILSKNINNEIAKTYYSKKDSEIIDEIESVITGNSLINVSNFLQKLRTRLEKNRKLHEKFKAFFIQLNIPVSELFNETTEIFVDKVVNTRNHFAHVNEKEPRVRIDELHLYNIKLEAILLSIFYLKLGLPLDKIKLKIRMYDRFEEVIK